MSRTTPERPVDIEALFPELSRHRRTATRLHPRPGTPTAHQSSVGGPFLWPADEPWPVCRERHRRSHGERPADIRLRRRILAEAWSRQTETGERPGPTDEEREILDGLEPGEHAPWLGETDPTPLLPVAQLFRRDVPDLKVPEGCDLLQLLWCPYDGHRELGTVGVHLRWRTASDVSGPLAEPPEPEIVGYQGYLPEPCVLHPEQVVEHEFRGLLPEDLQERIEEWEGWDNMDLYQVALSIAPGWKVGGFASWHLTDPAPVDCFSCGRPMELLLTVDSKEWDGGSKSWCPVEDQDRAGEPDANLPTQMVVGRGGSLNVFVCPADPIHPYRLSLQ